MPKIVVVKAFKLNINDVLTDYPVGVHDVDETVANHKYTRLHLASEDDVEKMKADAKAMDAEAKQAKADAEIAAKAAKELREIQEQAEADDLAAKQRIAEEAKKAAGKGASDLV